MDDLVNTLRTTDLVFGKPRPATCKEALQVQPDDTPRTCETCAHEEAVPWSAECHGCKENSGIDDHWTPKATASEER
jgi:hypothetical protein